MGLREVINQKPWLGWTLVGVFLGVGLTYLALGWGGGKDPYNPERLKEMVTVKFTDDGSTMQMPRGRIEKMIAERPELSESEGITNPKTGKPTGFLFDEDEWKEMITRLKAEKGGSASKSAPAPVDTAPK